MNNSINPAVDEAGNMPLASMLLLFYNQEKYVQQAVQGALDQTYPALEIILSDDGSSDETYQEMVKTVEGYRGPHRIVLNRNNSNLGLTSHVNKLVEMAEGEVILLSGGDDISMPDRVQDAMRFFSENEEYMAVSYSTVKFNNGSLPELDKEHFEDAVVQGFERDVYCSHPAFHLNGAARAFRKEAFTLYDSIADDCPTEDSVILLRCLLLGSVAQIKKPQVYYRIHEENLFASDRKYQIRYDLIHNQYCSDMKKAVSKGLLTQDQADLILETLEKRKERGMLKNGLHHSGNSFFYFLFHVFRSPVYGYKEKWRMFRSKIFKLGSKNTV